jgi:hypothetical protein
MRVRKQIKPQMNFLTEREFSGVLTPEAQVREIPLSFSKNFYVPAASYAEAAERTPCVAAG